MNNFVKAARLLQLVKRPSQEKSRPSNFALYWAWLFYNAVALLFDVIAAVTVYDLMGKFGYAILTFAAGFFPLLMHEFLFTRAYASRPQKVFAVLGACLSVVTILLVGVLAGTVNVWGVAVENTQMLEFVMVITLVLVAGAHGLIAAIYFYIDEGIKANQVRTESIAYHERRIDDIKRAKEILELAEKGQQEEDLLALKYGGMDVLNEILGQLRGDPASSDTIKSVQDVSHGNTSRVDPGAEVNAANVKEVAEKQRLPLSVMAGMWNDHGPNGHS
jgi:hypothetical protein